MAVDDLDWVRDAVFYQVFPDRFARSGRVDPPGPLEPWDTPPTARGFKGGDLLGVAQRLDYLVDLGINAIYLNPVFASASNHRYHTYDYLAVDPLLGGDAALRELLDRAHARGIRVVLDGVFNHASRGFWPFNHILECGIASPYLDWFHVDREALAAGRALRAYPDQAAQPGAGGDAPGGHAASSMSALGYQAWWDLPALPKLNTDNPKVREYLMTVAEHWIRFGADGWRLDVPSEIDDDAFWREFRHRVKAIKPEAYIVGEVWFEDHRWLKGDQFDAYMNYPLAFAALSFAAGPTRDDRVIEQQSNVRAAMDRLDGPGFARRLDHIMTTYAPEATAVQLNLLGSHDMPRILSICGGDRDSVRLATLVTMTVPGAPCIYYGDEIGMRGEHDPGCRGSFPTDAGAWDRDQLAFFQGVTALRHQHEALRRGTFAIVGSDASAVAWRRTGNEESWLVCVNAGQDAARLELGAPDLDGRRLDPVAPPGWPWPTGEAATVAGGRVEVVIPPRGALLVRAG